MSDLKDAAPVFYRQSETLRIAAKTLQTKLDSLGSPWGGDEQGNQFRDAYVPNRASIEKAVGILVEGLASIHDAMKDMADGHIENDELVKSLFTGVDRKAGH
ncbi:WXG100 family type VII secretion target [Streptomyces sp. 8N706]|uniref:WXG100 family type VII secretion target n=1 Tax=Streptomyces sp. 8N706 TaxID=3457416 RepID=UPI003FD2C9E9